MTGKVYLVGAGCGDLELMTVKGQRLLETCDAIVYDRLANPAFLDRVKDQAKRVYVGKQAANHAMQQEDINALLVDLAKQYGCVVRLKGGDPYVFGRGGEEALYLKEAGIAFEVVPGITSAIGGLAYAGIPITHRDVASSFHVITGHFKDDEMDHDWSKIAQYEGTLVFLMGLSHLDAICQALMTEGMSPDQPVALIEWASHPHQRKVIGSLATIGSLKEKHRIKTPSLIVVGQVVSLHASLDWFSVLPLQGKRIVVTRARNQASQLATKLTQLGAGVAEVPSIKIAPCGDEKLRQAIGSLKDYTMVLWTSANGVHRFFETLNAMGFDSRHLSHLKLAVVGSGTQKALRDYGLKADFMPSAYHSDALLAALLPHVTSHDHLLIPRAKNARKGLLEGLEGVARVEEIHVYESVAEAIEAVTIKDIIQADALTFTSASTVKHLVAQLDPASLIAVKGMPVYSIGPITTETLVANGFKKIITAKQHDIEGLVDTLINEVTL